MTHAQRVEVVAEAIRGALEKHLVAQGRGYLVPWDEMPDHRKQKYRDMAQAAIEVMRS